MDKNDLLNAAIELHSNGHFEEAKAIYLQLLESSPEQEQVLNNLGALEATCKNYQSASGYFRLITKLSPQKLSGWTGLASCLELSNDLSGAIKNYLMALDINNGNLQVLLALGGVYKKIRKFSEAKETYRKILSIDPKHKEALNNLGNLYRDLGQFKEALQCFELLLKHYEGDEVFYNNIATTYADLENHLNAIHFYDLALTHNPSYVLSLNGKGISLRELGKLEEAIKCFRSALKLDKNSFISQSNLAGALIASPCSDDEKIRQGKIALKIYLEDQKSFSDKSFPVFALKHHIEQAQYLLKNQINVPGAQSFIDAGELLISGSMSDDMLIYAGKKQYSMLKEYLSAHVEYEISSDIQYGLNPQKNWTQVEEEYFDSNEAIAIDDFLSTEALDALYKYCLISKLWIREYPKCYLGAFGYQGFITRLHLKIAHEISEYMPRIFKDYRLSHLWAFKYDAKLGSGINVHADPAKVNINFWLTPDEFNNEEGRGGLIVYGKKAREDWDFHEYNNDADKIYKYISDEVSQGMNVPYKRNRCVLFNSILFHETDKINFSDIYEGRRINMTYLFGSK